MDDPTSIATRVVETCSERWDLYSRVNIHIVEKSDIQCKGCCRRDSENEFSIWVARDQTIRDFVATVAHEMVHVRQWTRNHWHGDGEAEADEIQFMIADLMWESGKI